MITIKNITKKYSNYTALEDISLHIPSGEFVSLVGQSGTGKTTLVKLIIAEERPTSGEIIIGGWNITKIKSYEIPYLRRQIGVIFQDFKLLPKKTVYENVAFALESCGVAVQIVTKTVPQVLKIVGLENKLNHYPWQLSGGEKQRVAIARALVHKPKLLIADEPTGNLDSINTKEIIDLLLKINEIGTTVLLVSHNRDVVNGLRRRVITVENGKVISDQAKGRYVL